MSSSGTSSDVNMVDVDFEDQLPAHMQNATTDAQREEMKKKNARTDFAQSSGNSANVAPNNVDIMPIDKSDGATSSSTSLDVEGDAKNTIEMLRGNEISERISAANRLESVAVALGPQRVREELIPFLAERLDDEDEVLLAFATSLETFLPLVGGSAYAHFLLPLFEALLTVEESIVRESAAKSIKVIIQNCEDETFFQQYATMISRLSTIEWYSARISACGLIAMSLQKIPAKSQESHINHFADLCRDDVGMVLRIASHNLGNLLQNVVNTYGISALSKDGIVSTTLLPLYEELAVNEQDSVRLQTTENCVAFGNAISSIKEEDRKDLDELEASMLIDRVIPLVVASIDDRSWRVRWTAASKFAEVVKAFFKLQGALDILIPAYEKLLQDPEAEVRTAATFNLADVATCNSLITVKTSRNQDNDDQIEETSQTSTVAERLVKCVTSLTEDESEHVRAALAMVATNLAPILGKGATIENLVPPVLLLLRDSVPEVRLNLISSLAGLNEVIGIDLLSQSLLPAIVDLAADGKWRIRLAIIQIIPLLADQLGKEYFSEQLSSLCISWLADDISSIRQAAASNLKDLAALFGADWASIHLIPSITEIRRHPSYLRRLTAVQTCTLMSTVLNPDVARVELLPIILDMASDNVPNIRFNVAKGLATMSPICGNTACEAQIRPVLIVLSEDADRDVRFFASQALMSINKNIQANSANDSATPISNL